jgi:osmotically inducible protein OsmC
MPRISRAASVSWEGNLARGSGAISGDSGAIEGLPYTLATRIADPEGKTSPEELVAAAVGGCFTMSLAGELTRAERPPERLDVSAVCTVDISSLRSS